MNEAPMLLNIYAFINIVILCFVFFSKKRLHKIEDNLYAFLLISAFFTIGFGILLGPFLSISFPYKDIIIVIFNKIYLFGLVITISLFSYYTFCISKLYNPKSNTHRIVYFLFCFLFMFLIIILPINVDEVNGVAVTSGMAINMTSIMFAIVYVALVVLTFMDFKNLRNKKYIPIILLIFEGIIITLVQIFFPTFNYIINPSAVITCLVMYFTIENPDVKMIEQLNIAKSQAERANNAKTDFLSSMSHEIRTPLNAIDGFSQLILEEDDINVIKDEARDIITASQNLLEIVNGILDISKIEANKLEIINKEYEPSLVFDELIKLTKARIGDKPLDFRVAIDKDIPDYLNGDYVRLKQIVVNLLTNAVKYTKEGFVEFKVNTVKKDNVCRLIISVKDSGIGIKKENIDKLFTKFERFDLEKNMTIEGTGLGLAITKKLVDLMHGSIVVDSVYGKGSTFTVAIDQRIVNKEKKKEEVKEIKEVKVVSGKGKKVLIVDDNLINLKVAARLLSTYKIETESVTSGFDCLKKIEEGNSYDLILMDDMMPKMSGIETFKKLQEMDNFNIPVIALTANAIAGMKEKYLNEGFNDYLSKPIDKKELERVLKTYLNK